MENCAEKLEDISKQKWSEDLSVQASWAKKLTHAG